MTMNHEPRYYCMFIGYYSQNVQYEHTKPDFAVPFCIKNIILSSLPNIFLYCTNYNTECPLPTTFSVSLRQQKSVGTAKEFGSFTNSSRRPNASVA